MTKVYVDKRYAFFKYVDVNTNSEIGKATIHLTECGNIPHIIQNLDRPRLRYIYCFSESLNPPFVRVPLIKYITPTPRYKQYADILGYAYPRIPVKEAKRDRLLTLIYDNYYFDMYALSVIKQSKYYHHIDLIDANGDRITAYATHMFCLYTNMSTHSDDLILLEAMMNGCVPVTHRDVPGIRFKTTGVKILKPFMNQVYEIEIPDVNEIDNAIDIALSLSREEIEDLREKAKEYAKRKYVYGLEEFIRTITSLRVSP